MSADASERSAGSTFVPKLAGGLEELVEAIARRATELQLELGGKENGDDERSPWLSVSSAAEYLDWPKGRLYKLSARGEIPHYKHEGRLLFRRDELDEWLSRFALGERP